MSRATLYTIATDLGLSASTVSRALSRPDRVRADVRERVLRRAEAVGYRPNRSARELVTGRTGLLGLLVPDITNPYFPPLIRAVQQAAAARGELVMVLDADDDPAREPLLLDQLSGQVDGWVLASPRATAAALVTAVGETPTVVVNRSIGGLGHVVCDVDSALSKAGDRLAALGHRRVALARGPGASWAAGQRAQAVRGWAGRSSVRLDDLGGYADSFDGGRAAASALVGTGATAVFAFDDLMAAGLVAGLSELDARVPTDISVIGCDDVLLARTHTPALATVRVPIAAMAYAAVAGARTARPDAASAAANEIGAEELRAVFIERASIGPTLLARPFGRVRTLPATGPVDDGRATDSLMGER